MKREKKQSRNIKGVTKRKENTAEQSECEMYYSLVDKCKRSSKAVYDCVFQY